MAIELDGAVKDVLFNTGLKIWIFSLSGVQEYGAPDFPFNFLPPARASHLKTFVCDKEENATFFRVNVCGKDFVAVIEGANQISENYAKMLRVIFSRESVPTRISVLTKEEKLKNYITGEMEHGQIAELKSEYALKQFDYYVLSFVTDSSAKLKELKSFLSAIGDKEDLVIPIDDKCVAFIKKCGTTEEYQSANDFAYTLYDNIKDELRINFVINVGGTTHSFDDLPAFYSQCAFAYSFGKLMSPSDNIYSYKEYIMIKMLSDIPKNSLTKYLGTLLDSSCLDIIADDELMSTAEEFLKNSLNISETSRSIYMHRNTLIYRLDKIENATGLNIRHFNDAVIFRLITILNKLTNSKI